MITKHRPRTPSLISQLSRCNRSAERHPTTIESQRIPGIVDSSAKSSQIGTAHQNLDSHRYFEYCVPSTDSPRSRQDCAPRPSHSVFLFTIHSSPVVPMHTAQFPGWYSFSRVPIKSVALFSNVSALLTSPCRNRERTSSTYWLKRDLS